MRTLLRSIMILPGFTAIPLVAGAQDRPWDGWGMHPMWGTWAVSMVVVMLIFWAVVIVGIVLGCRWFVAQRRPPGSDRALAVLRERYARGEINKDEFEAKRHDLEAA